MRLHAMFSYSQVKHNLQQGWRCILTSGKLLKMLNVFQQIWGCLLTKQSFLGSDGLIVNCSIYTWQALLAVWIYHDHKTSVWWVGNCVVLLGALLYTLVKMREEQVNQKIINNNNNETIIKINAIPAPKISMV